jgi:hypothetical protein
MRLKRKKQLKKYKHIVAKVHSEVAEPRYHITPKGCALLALADVDIVVEDEEWFNLFWESFEKHLENSGYMIVE